MYYSGFQETLTLNSKIKTALALYDTSNRNYIFTSQKGTRFSSQQVNRLLKEHFDSSKGQVSSHSLRKTFGRRVWYNNNQSEASLTYLSDIFNHSSTKTTRIYLGIHAEEIADIYLNL